MRILLAIDGSKCSDAAVNALAKRPWPAGAVVRVLLVIEPVTLPVPESVTMPETWYEAMRRAARADIERAVTLLKQSTCLEIETAIPIGSPQEMILKEASDWNADLIVVGCHGTSQAGQFLLGSVSQAIALNAPCSVEIVRQECKRAVEKTDYGHLAKESGDQQVQQANRF
jgi:nucleotide-binding universal stress UspA family protein